MAGSLIGQLAKKYAVVIFFPTFTTLTIYADWSHTQAWKKQQKLILQSQLLLKE